VECNILPGGRGGDIISRADEEKKRIKKPERKESRSILAEKKVSMRKEEHNTRKPEDRKKKFVQLRSRTEGKRREEKKNSRGAGQHGFR